MHILILGGSGFLGRHMTERALARGWQVTHFNRGKSNPDAYSQVETIRGDRKTDAGLGALKGRTFDSVIDTSGYFPRDVERSTGAMRGSAPHYVFISSISAYDDPKNDPVDETYPTAPWTDDLVDATEMTPEAYGPLKAECERRVQHAYGGGALIIRPGLIVGRYDPTGRFSYWPKRFREGGQIVVPDRMDAPVQFIDAFDLAEWTMDLCAAKHGGVLNATGPLEPLTWGELLDQLKPLAPAGTEVVALPDAILLDQGVGPWMELPLWLPAAIEEDGMMQADMTAQRETGLTIRPLTETFADIFADIDENGFQAGGSLTAEKEAKVLAARGS